MRRTIPQRVNPVTFYTVDTDVPETIKSFPTVARQTHLAVSSWGLAFSMGIVGALTCQSQAVAALPLNPTNFFAATSSASLLQAPESPAKPQLSDQVLSLPKFTTTDLPLQLGSGQSSWSTIAHAERSRLNEGLAGELDASVEESTSADPEQVATLSLQLSPSNSSPEEQGTTSHAAPAEASIKEASVPTELSKIIASLPTLNGKAHRSLVLAQPTKIATTSLELVGPLVAVSPETAPLSQPAAEVPSSSVALPSKASEQSLTVSQSSEAGTTPASAQAQDAIAAIPGQRPAVNLSPNVDLSVPVAKRAVFPQLPTMELPPLASADTYLPSGSEGKASFSGRIRFISPARGVLTSGYGPRWGRMHRGIDIAGPVGTTIMASAPGVVASAGWNSGGYGNLVEVLHPDGSLTLYAHNSRIVARRGQQVQQGQKIAEMGSTGRSTGPHVHFEIHPAGRGAVNPMIYISRG